MSQTGGFVNGSGSPNARQAGMPRYAGAGSAGSPSSNNSSSDAASLAARRAAAQMQLSNLLRRLQPAPGQTRQQKFQELMRNGELSASDLQLLKRQQEIMKRRSNQQMAAAAAGKSVTGRTAGMPGHRIAGKNVPGKSVPRQGSGAAGKTVPSAADYQRIHEQRRLQAQAAMQQRQREILQQQQRQQQQQHQQQQRIQQSQMLLGLNAEQMAKMTTQQRQMYVIQQLRKRARTQQFYESNEELLKKYEKLPASFELHVHENHYRFGSKDTVIPKDSPTIKEFLKYVARGEIPEALMEVIRDGGIRMYDGSLILQVFDHRQAEEASSSSKESKSSENNEPFSAASPGNAGGDEKEQGPKPKEYRTILRMSQLALFDDLAMQTDSQQFHDTFALTFEGEILTTLNRNVNLQPVLNPFLVDESLRPNYETVVPTYDAEHDTMVFPHREDARETGDVEPITCDNMKYKPLHEDMSQSNSQYEQLMTVLSQVYRHSNRVSEPSNELGDQPAHFERLRFIEMWRNKMAVLKQQALNGTLKAPMVPGAQAGSAATGFGGFMTPQERVIISRQQLMNQQHKQQMADAMAATGNPSVSGGTPEVGTPKSDGSPAAGAKKKPGRKKGEKKPRKPRKPTKKQLAAQAAAQAAQLNGGSPDAAAAAAAKSPPKKRKAYKRRKKDTVKKENS